MMPLGDDIASLRRAAKERFGRLVLDCGFAWLCRIVATLSIVILTVLLYSIISRGWQHLTPKFVLSAPHSDPDSAGIFPALMGTFWTCALCGLLTFPIGIGSAIFLEEFQPRKLWSRRFHKLVQLQITNLAGVPSIVYGLVGLAAFVNMFGLLDRTTQKSGDKPYVFEIGSTYYDQFLTLEDEVVLVPVTNSHAPDTEFDKDTQAIDQSGRWVRVHRLGKGETEPSADDERAVTIRWNETPGRIARHNWYHFRVPLGRGVLAGSLTLMLVILPIVIIAAQESIRSVPSSLREASLGMGATSWQTVWNVTLPVALPGILTGFILALSRAIGEAAPIMMISGVVFVMNGPTTLMSEFTVLSLQIFDWASSHEPRFQAISASAIIVLLTVLMAFNGVAALMRHWLSRPMS